MTVPSAAKGRTAMTAEAAAGRLWLVSPATALILGGLVLALTVADVPLSDMAHQLSVSAAVPAVVALDWVRADLAGVVHQALEPAHVSVWVKGGGR